MHHRGDFTCIAELRAIVTGCEQKNRWFGEAECQWALPVSRPVSLPPFARCRDREDQVNRHLPFLPAGRADVAEVPVEYADGVASGGRPQMPRGDREPVPRTVPGG
ncbi:hypothetical protein ACIRTB_03460 [Streptomyces sp. NPDC101158]|uniref:hypothetical protein n=1 Tax=Streptomyces sp. NPDC101158 TaxID=3366117 RepID=UPI0037F277D4